ncbi:MAG TPA: hypothetical protein PLN52_26135 [Opitutaceae bacterium]|nr:hypothetical protein [Opitutaceae bacterium]
MSLLSRVQLFHEIENYRKRPLIVYVTSMRRNLAGEIARDVVSEILSQLEALPKNTKELDFFLASYGGDGTVAWRIVSLIRERVETFSVLIPQAAFSAATLIALGADEIVMHPNGNLGPTDPQITNQSKNVRFGAEDLAAYLKFARDEVGLTDQAPMLELFKQFSAEVGFVGVGVAARGSQMSQTMGEKLLRLHMKSESQSQKAKLISDALNKKFFHHGYPVSRSEAKEIGLPIAEADPTLDSKIWRLWLDIEEELKFREPFSPAKLLKEDHRCAGLFSNPLPTTPPAAYTTEFEHVAGVVESCRKASRSVTSGDINATRGPDMGLKVSMLSFKDGWISVDVPTVESAPQPTEKKTNRQNRRGHEIKSA